MNRRVENPFLYVRKKPQVYHDAKQIEFPVSGLGMTRITYGNLKCQWPRRNEGDVSHIFFLLVASFPRGKTIQQPAFRQKTSGKLYVPANMQQIEFFGDSERNRLGEQFSVNCSLPRGSNVFYEKPLVIICPAICLSGMIGVMADKLECDVCVNCLSSLMSQKTSLSSIPRICVRNDLSVEFSKFLAQTQLLHMWFWMLGDERIMTLSLLLLSQHVKMNDYTLCCRVPVSGSRRD